MKSHGNGSYGQKWPGELKNITQGLVKYIISFVPECIFFFNSSCRLSTLVSFISLRLGFVPHLGGSIPDKPLLKKERKHKQEMLERSR